MVVLFGPWPSITNRTLSAERNRLLGAFVLSVAVSYAFGALFHFYLPWGRLGGYAPLLIVSARVIYAYFAYRASSLLRQPSWLTVVFVALGLVPGFEVISLVGLLISIRLTRGGLDENV